MDFLNENIPGIFCTWEAPNEQFGGRNMTLNLWRNKVSEDDFGHFPDPPISSPANIIQSFINEHYLVGLAQVVSWGTMWRHPKKIYTSPLERMENILIKCRGNLNRTDSINGSWHILSNQLNWSPVIISKVLHFLVRSLELPIAINPPVAIDNKVILKKVWPTLVQNFESPGNWNDGLEGYLRYMTFINYLRMNHYLEWTNTQIEATLFYHFNH